jgi:hypothetical protein
MAVAKRQAEFRYPGDFYGRYTIEELARMQGVRPVNNFESLLGGWPADEIDDGFEDAVAGWRGPHQSSEKADCPVAFTDLFPAS